MGMAATRAILLTLKSVFWLLTEAGKDVRNCQESDRRIVDGSPLAT